MKQWFERHAQTLVGSLGRLWQHPFATLLTVIVIGIALALPACLHVLVQNVRVASGGWNNALDISVYMQPDATLDQAKRAAERIRQRRDVDEVTLIEADAALEEFRKHSGFGTALDALKDNPLPHALVVRPDPAFRDSGHVEALAVPLQRRVVRARRRPHRRCDRRDCGRHPEHAGAAHLRSLRQPVPARGRWGSRLAGPARRGRGARLARLFHRRDEGAARDRTQVTRLGAVGVYGPHNLLF
ncbi:MAG: hypothetical protein K0R70_2499 [Steroidobacteraceae bacterium]|nr:hypothetical protein [Steroidobacteraceae bacterium]